MQWLFPRLMNPDDAEAVRVDGRSLTYQELSVRVAAHLARLAALGVRPGDRVGVFTHPTVDVVAAVVAQVTYGVVTIPLNPALATRELEHMVNDAQPVVVFVDHRHRQDLKVSAALHGRLQSLQDTESVTSPHGFPWTPRAVTDDVAFVLYTSGTTGAPKGAQLSSANVAANLDALALTWGWSERDTVVHALPLFHVHGLVLGLLGSLRVGGALHHVSRFAPETLATALARVTPGRGLLFAVPTMYHRLIDAAEAEVQANAGTPIANALRAARLLISGSAGLPVREHQRLRALTGRGIHERYGLTETLINCAVPATETARPGYVGPGLPGVTVRRVDETRTPLPREADDDATLGEVAVRGPNVFLGYLNRDEDTRAVLDADGWFYTGDLATATPDGALRIVGRRGTDLIKTGGYKVGAGEIEASLLEHSDVAEVAALGVPDPDLGERIVAFVVPRAGAGALEAALQAHAAANLTRHKQPREYRVVDALPRNAMGKVQKARLLDGYAPAASEPASEAAFTPPPPEVRIDPFTGFPVIVSSARAQIRHGADPGAGLPKPSGPCPFCPGQEDSTEAAVLRLPADAQLPWQVRFVPNRYPWVVEGPVDGCFQHAPGGESYPALGVHDVVVEHPDHDLDLVDYDDDHLLLLLTALRDRVRALEAVPGVLSVSLFRNRGRRAGSSQPHPHAQLVAASVLGPTQLARRARAREHFADHGTNLLASQVALERRARERVVLDDGTWFAGCPFAPRHPYEVWFGPQVPDDRSAPTPFSALSTHTLGQLGSRLRTLVRATLAASGKQDYNLVLHQMPVAERQAPHAYWCIEIAPRGGGGAGFELSTGLAMTSTRPEANAARIRMELAAATRGTVNESP